MGHRIKDPELRAYLKQLRAQAEAEAEAAEQGPPVIVYGDVGRRLRNQLLRIVCSQRWEDDIVDGINDARLPPPAKTVAAERRVLHESEFYPPGGDHTAMLQCLVCTRHLPPQVVGSVGVCYECFKERQVTCYLYGRPIDPEKLLRLRTAGKISQAQFEEAIQPLERVITDAGARHMTQTAIPKKDAIALLGRAHQFSRRRGRKLFITDDPTVRGGKIDEDKDLIIEPWGAEGDAGTRGHGEQRVA